jgi:hypothetical protein
MQLVGAADRLIVKKPSAVLTLRGRKSTDLANDGFIGRQRNFLRLKAVFHAARAAVYHAPSTIFLDIGEDYSIDGD